jgi:hypothetical protein
MGLHMSTLHIPEFDAITDEYNRFDTHTYFACLYIFKVEVEWSGGVGGGGGVK